MIDKNRKIIGLPEAPSDFVDISVLLVEDLDCDFKRADALADGRAKRVALKHASKKKNRRADSSISDRAVRTGDLTKKNKQLA